MATAFNYETNQRVQGRVSLGLRTAAQETEDGVGAVLARYNAIEDELMRVHEDERQPGDVVVWIDSSSHDGSCGY